MSERAIAVKQKKVDEIKDKISRSSMMVLSDYQGFTVKEMTDLRKKLRVENSELRIVKNTLLERAVGQSGLDELKSHLKGSTAVLFGYADPVSPLKILVKFIKDGEKGVVRAGVVDKKVYNDADLNAIANLQGLFTLDFFSVHFCSIAAARVPNVGDTVVQPH